MNTINQAMAWVTDPLLALYNRLAILAPNLIGALALLLVGYLLGKLVGAVVQRMLVRLGIDELAKRSGLQDFLQ